MNGTYYHNPGGHSTPGRQVYLRVHLGWSGLAIAEMKHLLGGRSLRSGGAMALLCGGADTNVIQLVGRWRSDAMFRYLHAQALPLIAPLATTMLTSGSFTLMPGSDMPAHAPPILAQALHPHATI